MTVIKDSTIYVNDVVTKGIVRDIRAYNGSLVAAVNDIGSQEVTLLISQPVTFNQDLTIPENICLKFLKGCPITIGTKSETTETIATGDGSTTSFNYTVTDPPIARNSVTITYTINGVEYVANDNGVGIISGTDLSGDVDYHSGNISLMFSAAPDDGTEIVVAYRPTYVLTINGPIKAGLWQVFDGDGVVTGSPKMEAIYPEWFGAVGDGEADDTDAIQRALRFINYNGILRFCQKVYKINGSISGFPSNSADDMIYSLMIDGNNAILKKENEGYILDSSDVDGYFCGLKIVNLSFYGGEDKKGSGILVDKFYRVRIFNCQFKKLDKAIGESYAQSLYVIVCSFHNCNYAFKCERLYDIKFTHNMVEHGLHGIYWDGDNNPIINSGVISYNLIEGMSGYPIYSGGCFGLEISNNYFEMSPNYPDIVLTHGTSSGAYRGLRIINNHFVPTDEQASDPNYYSIVLDKDKISESYSPEISGNVSAIDRLVTPDNKYYLGGGNTTSDGKPILINQGVGVAITLPPGNNGTEAYIQKDRTNYFNSADSSWEIMRLTPFLMRETIMYPKLLRITFSIAFLNSGLNLLGSCVGYINLFIAKDVDGNLLAKVLDYHVVDVGGNRSSGTAAEAFIKDTTSIEAVIDGSEVILRIVDVNDPTVENLGQTEYIQVGYGTVDFKTRAPRFEDLVIA